MPYTAPTVNYSTAMNGTYTTLTGVLSVSFNRGRQRFMDPFPPTSCQIELIPANSYATPLEVGQFIDVRPTNSASSEAYFVGEITDVERTYDMPYNSVTGAAPGDRIRITALGALGLIGRATFTDDLIFSVPSTDAATTIQQSARRLLNVNPIPTNGGFGRSVQNFTTSDPTLDVINQLAATEPLYLSDRDNARTIVSNPGPSTRPGFGPLEFSMHMVGQRAEQVDAFVFTDSGGGYFYNQISYGTGAQNFFTQVNVITENADGVSNIPVQQVSTGLQPFSSLDWNTYNADQTEANSLANYVFTRSYVPAPAPMMISSTTAVDDSITQLARMNTILPGQRGQVTFRGQTYRVTLEGFDFAFYVDRAAITAYFSPFPLDYFILDSASNGRLDVNRLAAP